MDCRKWIERYSIDCKLKYNSFNTQNNYISQVTSFCFKFNEYREPKEIPTEKIKLWILEKDSPNTRNHRLCSIKSFYELTVGMPVKLDKIPFSKKDKKLPIVLSVSEIQKLFDVCENLKHKTILALLYSCGFRISELINLEWKHIDRERGIINIIAGKGKKDRQVSLNEILIKLLTEYWKKYKPVQFVLNGQSGSLQYSERSVNEVLKQIADKAGIRKKIHAHLIRHCHATHLVENGTDINIIQKLLGHTNVKTTNIYLHISHNHISKIQSPLSQIQL